MNSDTYFSLLCRELANNLQIDSPSIKGLVRNKKTMDKNGVVARYYFNQFYMDIYYIHTLKGNGAQQVIWLSFFFEQEPSVTFTIYDILSVTHPQNFSCYTYSFVDSDELLKNCFNEIGELMKAVLPALTEISQNGVQKNKLIDRQKEKINAYFGSNIFEAENFLNESAEKIISMMFYNFFQHQIDTYLMGAPATFFKGKEEKALKALKKSKHRSLYEDNLLKHIEQGGKAPALSQTAQYATAEKGLVRQGSDTKSALKILLYTILFAIPISLLMCGLFFFFTYFSASGSIFVFGIKENLLFIPFFSLMPSVAIALNMYSNKKIKNKDIHLIPVPAKAKKFLKYFTIFAESVAIIVLFSCINSTLILNESNFLYSTESLPLTRTAGEYSSIDYVAIVEGYNYDGKFQKDKHIAFVTKSGNIIDLYNSTFFSTEEFKKETESFLKEKNIEIKEVKTIE